MFTQIPNFTVTTFAVTSDGDVYVGIDTYDALDQHTEDVIRSTRRPTVGTCGYCGLMGPITDSDLDLDWYLTA